MSESFYGAGKWSFVAIHGTGAGDTDLLAAPGAGRRIVVQHLTVTVTTANAATFNIEDKSATPKVFFAAPTSLAVGSYYVNLGPLGVATTDANVALEIDVSAAGPGATISAYGYYQEAA